jgi:hypothetical protein
MQKREMHPVAGRLATMDSLATIDQVDSAASPLAPELLAADIEAIALVADVLCARDRADALEPPIDIPAAPPGFAFSLRRTADSVPVVLGSVLGVLMLVVFSAAATFVKLAR